MLLLHFLQTFMPLSIPVPAGRGISKVTLEDCIAQFVKEEVLDKDDAWYVDPLTTTASASLLADMHGLVDG